MTGSRTATWLDRPWAMDRSTGIMFDIAAPDVHVLRATYARFLAQRPDDAVNSRLSPDFLRWERIPQAERAAHAERVITFDPALPNADPAGYLAERVLDRYSNLPFKVVVGPRSVATFTNHMLGDGTTFSRVNAGAVTNDFDTWAAFEPRARLGQLRPAALRGARKHGRQWAHIARAGGPALAPGSSDGPDPVTGAVGITMTREEFAATNTWRKQALPGVGLTAIYTSAYLLALRAEGVAAESRAFHVLIDARRYLPEAQRAVAGNLSKSLLVETDVADPAAVQAAIGEAVSVERVVPAIMQGSVTTGLKRIDGRERTHSRGPIVLSVSSMPSLPGREAAPWIDPDDAHYVGFGYSPVDTGASCFAVGISGRVEFTMSFDRHTIDPAVARRAIERLHALPSLF